MRSYPHMCRCDHDEIGYSESNTSDERCPLCRSMDACDQLDLKNEELTARIAKLEAELPDDYSWSKDWRHGNAVSRIQWLKTMIETYRSEIDRYESSATEEPT